MGFYQGNGYDGLSMSNNARRAYGDGQMPWSKWTVAEILAGVAGIDAGKAAMLKGVRADVLRRNALRPAGWHHTSYMYNRTSFYQIDQDWVEALTLEKAAELRAIRPEREKPESVARKGTFEYLEWSGGRMHPKAKTVRLKNVTVVQKGATYYVKDADGNPIITKRVDSRGTYFYRGE